MHSFLERSLLFAMIVATATTAAAPASAQLKTVTVGQVAPSPIFWPGFIAQKQKFYENEGLQVEGVVVDSVGGVVQQLVGGSIDFAFITSETALRAIDKGAEIAIIGETVVKWPYSMMVTRNIKTVRDLRGKKVMLPAPNQDLTMLWYRWLKEQDMNPKLMEEVFDPVAPSRYGALVSGVASAAPVSQPQDFIALRDGYKQLVDFAMLPGQDLAYGVIVTSRKLLREQPEKARAFLLAVGNAINWWYEPKNKDAAIAILQEVTKTDRALSTQTYDYYFDKVQMPFSRNARVRMSGERNLINMLADDGSIKERDPAKYIDASFLPK